MDKLYDVKLYVYEITKGLARTMSPMFLGRQIDGVWHTAVVVYEQEFFFGGMGIESCTPGGTILGQPDSIISLGATELPSDLFMEHLHELSRSSFRPTCYHLFNHNCNTFSDEIAQFLTGKKIPDYITNLPQEVLQTPFGAMIKPFVDSMSASPQGGHTLFDDDVPHGDSSAASFQPVTRSSNTTNRELPPVATYDKKSELSQYKQQRDSLVSHLSQSDVSLVDEAFEYVSATNSQNWSLGPPHVKLLCRLIVDNQLSEALRITLSIVLQMALLFDDVISVCVHDPNKSFVSLMQSLDSCDIPLSIAVAKCICNFASTKVGAEKLAVIPHESSTLFQHVGCHLLLQSDRDLKRIGSQVISNVFRQLQNVPDDVAFDLGIALIEACQNADENCAEYLWFDLCTCIQFKMELVALVTTMGLELDEHEKKFPAIVKYTAAAKLKYFS